MFIVVMKFALVLSKINLYYWYSRMIFIMNFVAGESLGQALDRAFAERIKLPEGDTAHAGAPIQDTRAAPIPGPPSPPTDKDKGQGKAQEKAEANGDVEQPTETTAAGIAQAGHEQTDAVDPSLSSSAPHSGGPTGGSSDTHACTRRHTHARIPSCMQATQLAGAVLHCLQSMFGNGLLIARSTLPVATTCSSWQRQECDSPCHLCLPYKAAAWSTSVGGEVVCMICFC